MLQISNTSFETERTNFPTKSEITVFVVKLASGFPSVQLTEDNLKTFVDELAQEDFPFDILKPSLVVVFRECKFFPSIAELIHLLHKFREQNYPKEYISVAEKLARAAEFDSKQVRLKPNGEVWNGGKMNGKSAN